jgi:hypothetical protein
MTADHPLPPLLRRAPALLSGFLTAFTVALAHSSFAQGSTHAGTLSLSLGVALAGLFVSELLTGGLDYLPATSVLEVVGSAWLLLGLFISLALHYLNVFPSGLESWELVVVALAGMTFFLRSQRSFLLLMTLDSLMVLVALLHRPNAWAAASYSALVVVLLSLLSHREKLEESRWPEPASDPWIPLRPVPVALIGLFLVLGFFLALKTGEGTTIGSLLESGPAGGGRPRLSSRLDREMSDELQDDPFRSGDEAGAGTAAPGDLRTSLLTFQRDLKFGDRPEGGGEAVLLYAQLRDRSGTATAAEGVPLYFLTGVVTKYDGRSWSPDPSPSTIREGRGGPVAFALEPGEATAVWLEERMILAPFATGSLFALYPVERISLDRIAVDGEGVLSRTGPHEGRFKYTVASLVLHPSPADLERSVPRHPDPRYLQVPAGFGEDPGASEVVRQLKSRAPTPQGRIRAALDYLGEFKYTLTPGLDPKADPTLEFLRRRQGYCQHFSSALALLLRQTGIPARIGIGVVKGEKREEEPMYVFRRKHAHSWVEVHFERIGWVPFDPAARPLEAMLAAPEPPAPASLSPEGSRADTRPPAPSLALRPESSSGFRSGRGENDDPGRDPAFTAPRRMPFQDPPLERSSGEASFQDLWDAIENRTLGEASGGGALGSEAARRRGRAGTRGGSLRDRVLAAGGALWSYARDLLIVFAAGAVLYAIVARLVRRRRRRSGRGEEELAEERFLDEEEGERADGRSLREAVPKGTYRRRIAELYLDLLGRFARAGLARSASQTPREYEAWVSERLAAAPPGLVTLTGLFQDARYGTGDMHPGSLSIAKAAHREALLSLESN